MACTCCRSGGLGGVWKTRRGHHGFDLVWLHEFKMAFVSIIFCRAVDSKNFEVLIEGDALIFVHHRPGTDDLQVAGEVVHTQAWEYWTGVCVPLQMRSP